MCLDETTQPSLLPRLTETPSPSVFQHIDPIERAYKPQFGQGNLIRVRIYTDQGCDQGLRSSPW